jgi:hypothetical protein
MSVTSANKQLRESVDAINSWLGLPAPFLAEGASVACMQRSEIRN